MKTRTIKGIVVREQAHGESDKFLFVLTQTEGVLLVKAKGAKKITAAFLKSVQLFAYSEMLVYDKNGFLTLTEARLIESFYSVRQTLEGFALASYLCELSDKCVVTGQDDGILRLLLNSLYAITRNTAPLHQIKAVFEYRLCMTIGYFVDSTTCECGDKGIGYDFINQCFVCKKCAVSDHMTIPDSVLKTLGFLAECPDSRMLSFKLDDESMAVFNTFAERFLQSVTDIHAESLKLFKSL